MMIMLRVLKLAISNNKVLRTFDARWADGMKSGFQIHPVPDIINEIRARLLYLSACCSAISVAIICAKIYEDPTNPTLIALGTIMSASVTLLSLKARCIWQSIRDRKNAQEFMVIVSLMESIYKKVKLTDNMWEWDQYNAADSGTPILNYLRSQARKLQQLELISWRKLEEESLRKQFDWELDKLSKIALIPSAREIYFRPDEECQLKYHKSIRTTSVSGQ